MLVELEPELDTRALVSQGKGDKKAFNLPLARYRYSYSFNAEREGERTPRIFTFSQRRTRGGKNAKNIYTSTAERSQNLKGVTEASY